jgi:hypothetical protein
LLLYFYYSIIKEKILLNFQQKGENFEKISEYIKEMSAF